MSEDKLEFYDALETNDSAVKVRGDKILRTITRELVKRILHKYNYPPDKQERVTQTVLEQAELLLAERATT